MGRLLRFQRLVSSLVLLGWAGLVQAQSVVTNTNDSGTGSFRDALLAANANCTAGLTISFNITGTGPFTIAPASPLPDVMCPLVIDGYTQPGASPNTQFPDTGAGNDANIMIILNGSAAGASHGLSIVANNVTVRGLAVRSFANEGIFVTGNNAVIAGNYVGTDPGGMTAFGNGLAGIKVLGGNAQVGGFSPGDVNFVTSNSVAGIQIASTNTVVANNQVGGNRSGGGTLFSNGNGIEFYGSGNSARNNVVRFQGASGIYVDPMANTVLLTANSISFTTNKGLDVRGNTGTLPPLVSMVTDDFTGVNPASTIQGTFNAPNPGAYTIEVFDNSTGSATVPSGKRFVGNFSFNAATAGSVPYSATVNQTLKNPSVTLTGAAGSQTSEFNALYLSPQISPGTMPTPFFTQVGTPQNQTITLNVNSVLTVSAISVAGTGYSKTADTCVGTNFSAPGSCSLVITFSPTAPGNADVVVTLDVTDANSIPNRIIRVIRGSAVTTTPTTLSLSTSALDFGTRQIGATPSNQIVTVTNTGNANLMLGAITSTGSGGTNDYSTRDTCGSPVPPGMSCDITVTFAASAAGVRNALLTFTSNTPASPHTIALTGVGAAPTVPDITLSNASLDFGQQIINTPSSARRITILSSGTGDLTINGFSSNGNFSFVSNCPIAPNRLLAGSSCGLDVTFTPSALGVVSGAITINSDASRGAVTTIALAGEGIAAPVPTLSLSATTISFTDRIVGSASPAMLVVLTNTSTANLAISSIAVVGAGFVRAATLPAGNGPPDCDKVVAAKAACSIGVVFNPTQVGPQNGQLSIVSNAAGSPAVVTLSGVGLPVLMPIISLSGALVFADQVIGTVSAPQTVSVSNIGTAPLTLGSIGLAGTHAGEFAFNNRCPSALSPNASCTVDLVFAPQTTGLKNARLNVITDAANAGQVSSVGLSGAAIPVPKPIVRLSATSVGFGNAPFNTKAASQRITLTNVGNLALQINGISTGSNEFPVTHNCGNTLAVQASCMIEVSYVPQGLGSRMGELQVRTNADSSPNRVQLTGNGCRPYSPSASRFVLSVCGKT